MRGGENFERSYPATFIDCPSRVAETKFLRFKCENYLSFVEARCLYHSKQPSTTFAAITTRIVSSNMLFPEDGCLPRITRSGLAPFNNVMIVKVPEQFRKPGETIFQLATLDPSRKTERWPADKFIYKTSVIGEVVLPDSSDVDSVKEKNFEIPKFELGSQKSLFTLEKKRSKSNFSSAANPEHDKRVSTNVKSYKNYQDFKNQTTRNHHDFRKSCPAKPQSDSRGFRNRDYNEDKSHARSNNDRAMNIHPWINPPLEYANTIMSINPRYDETMPNNELPNHNLELLRQQSKSSRFYDGGDERYIPGSQLIERMPVKNPHNISQTDFMAFPEQPPRNMNWERPLKPKRGLLSTPIKTGPALNLFDDPPQINHPKTGYFEPNRIVPEKSNFRPPPRRSRHVEETFSFESSFNSSYDALPDFQYGNQYDISGPDSEYVNDRSYIRNNRDEPNYNRSHNIDPNSKAMPFNNNLNEIDSFRNNDFPRPYPIPGNVSEYEDRRYEQNSGKGPFSRKPEGIGRGNSFKHRNHNKWRGHRNRGSYRGSRGNRYMKGQQNDRFQNKAAKEGEQHN